MLKQLKIYLKILTLANDPVSVSDIIRQTGLAQTTAYHHVNKLKDAGLLETLGKRLVGTKRQVIYQSVITKLLLEMSNGKYVLRVEKRWEEPLYTEFPKRK